LNFFHELNMFLFSCDWKEAFKKEKSWDKQEHKSSSFIGA
jgi:hypothetical protein